MLSIRQYFLRRGVDPKDGVRHEMPAIANGSIRYLLTSLNFVRNLTNGDQILPRLKEDLCLARCEINISMYLFFNDAIGQELVSILISKVSDHDNPVRVRVLFDFDKTEVGHGITPPDDTKGLVNQMRAGGVEVIDTGIDYDKVISSGNSLYDTNETNIRNTVVIDANIADHRKLITIDGTVAYCGSANIGAEYFYHIPFDPSKSAQDESKTAKEANLPEAWEKWHDGLVRFIGPIVPQLNEVFRERWVLDGGNDYITTYFDPCHIARLDGFAADHLNIFIGQPAGKPNPVKDVFLQLIESSRSSIFIENPYLYHPAIVEALINAAHNYPLLKIYLVLPNTKQDDSILSYDAQTFRYQMYLPAGINVYEYQNHFNHLKIAVFDERYAIVGSANLNYRSMENDRDFELVILVDCPAFAQDVNLCIRDLDISRSKQFTLSDVKGPCSDGWPVNCRDLATIAAEETREI